jgi:hypothetical protein
MAIEHPREVSHKLAFFGQSRVPTSDDPQKLVGKPSGPAPQPKRFDARMAPRTPGLRQSSTVIAAAGTSLLEPGDLVRVRPKSEPGLSSSSAEKH